MWYLASYGKWSFCRFLCQRAVGDRFVIRTQAYFQKRTGSHKYITQTHLSHQSYGIVTRIQSTYNRFSEHAKRQKDTCFSVTNNKVTLRNGMTPDKLKNVL